MYIVYLLLFIFISFIVIRVIYSSAMLLYNNYTTLGTFKEIAEEYKKRYCISQELLSILKNKHINEENYINEVENLQKEIIELGTRVQNIDRRIALDAKLKNEMQKIISAIELDSNLYADTKLQELIIMFNNLISEADDKIKLYNISASKLRHSVDVFPSSLVARFLNIKTKDYIRK